MPEPLSTEEQVSPSQEEARLDRIIEEQRREIERLRKLWEIVGTNRHGVYDDTVALKYVRGEPV